MTTKHAALAAKIQTPTFRVRVARAGAALNACEAVITAMRAQRVTQAELSRRTGVGRAAVLKWLSGDRNLTIGTLAMIADALNLRLDVRLVEKRGGK